MTLMNILKKAIEEATNPMLKKLLIANQSAKSNEVVLIKNIDGILI